MNLARWFRSEEPSWGAFSSSTSALPTFTSTLMLDLEAFLFPYTHQNQLLGHISKVDTHISTDRAAELTHRIQLIDVCGGP